MTCARRDTMLMALHCGEPATADCDECARALADESMFVRAVESGLAGIRAPRISSLVRAKIAPRVRRPVRRPATSAAPFAIAAAALLASVALVIALFPKKPTEPVVRAVPPRQLEPTVPELPKPEPVKPEPKPPEPEPVRPHEPEPKPPEPPVKPPPEQPEPRPPEKPPQKTIEQPAAEIAAVVRSGALSVAGRKMTGSISIPAGTEFRADGRVRLEFANAAITLDAGSKGSLDVNAIALTDGEMLVDAPGSTPLELRLATPVRSASPVGRFVAFARPDAIFVDEGAARSGTMVLAEGRQYRLGAEPVAVKRTLGEKWKSSMARETVLWSCDFDSGKAPKGVSIDALFAQKAVKTTKIEANPFYYAHVRLLSDDRKLFVAKPATHIRFRYFVKKATALTVQTQNLSKDENFEVTIAEPIVGEWTTVTLRVMDLPVNPGGKKAVVEAGDVFPWMRWLVGAPGKEAEAIIDDLQVLEITR